MPFDGYLHRDNPSSAMDTVTDRMKSISILRVDGTCSS
jgi:hypothetical protein